MNKKNAVILIVVLVLIITVAAFVRISTKGKVKTSINAPTTSVPAAGNSGTSAAAENDEDAKAIESELGSIDDSDFSEDNLSDQNVGL